MRKPPILLAPVLIIALCVALPAQAKVLTAQIASLKTGAGSMRQVQVVLDWPDGAASGTLRLRAASLDFPALSYSAKNLDWQCPLQRTAASGWRCAGSGHANGKAAFSLALDIAPGATVAGLRVGDSFAEYRTLAASPDLSRIKLEKVPVDWLKAFLAGLWPEGRWTQGQLGGQVDLLAPKQGPFEVRSDLALAGVSLETPDGLLAAASLKGRLQVDYREQGKTQAIDTKFTVRGGELLANSFYAVFPATPVDIQVSAQRAGQGAWQLPRIRWSDPGVADVQGSAVLDAQAAISGLDLNLEFADLSVARDRYLTGFLAPAGFPDLLLGGAVSAQVRMQAGRLQDMQARFKSVNAIDDKARFTFAGVDGDLRWSQGGGAVASELGWSSGAIYGIGLGAARYAFHSANGELRLDRPVALDVLEGKLVLDHLRWQAPSDEAGAESGAGAKFQFGLSMDRLDLASLSQRLGWPPFTGTLGGKIPSARFEDNLLAIDGGLWMDLFGGSINLGDLVMERPFGVAPTLSADVEIKGIDMEPMTGVFGFGAITGRLDGRIDRLRLVNWSPVAFDARLETDRSWKGKRRISQRAVKDISSVGGGGLIGGLQTKVLQIFNDFGYDRIGIACALKDNVCRMDGIGSAGDGYIIVAGAGLPRIQVVGFRRRVDWPTLVSRLQAATEGQAPVIQ